MVSQHCAHCNCSHDLPFSAELLEKARRARSLPLGEERTQLMVEIGNEFTDEHELEDLRVPDEVHEIVMNYATLRSEMMAACIAVARSVVRSIDAFDAHLRTPPSTPFPGTSKVRKDVGPN